jgi:uncharacterized protein (DUF58 family)
VPRPGRRAFGLVLGAVVLFVVGTNNQAGGLIVLSSLLLGVAVAGTALPVLMVRRIAAERQAPREAFQGSPIAVDLSLRNKGAGPKLAITLRDAHIQPVSVFLSHLAPGERAVLTTRRTATRRGPVDGEALVVSSAAPFGVAEARRRIPAPGRTMVYPRVVPLPPVPFSSGAFAPGDESARELRAGGHQEFLSVREYRAGDSMRHVHWRSTARVGTLMVREFEREQAPRLGILVDTSIDAGLEDTPLDLACSIAASVALSALAHEHAVVLMAAEEGTMVRTRSAGRSAVLARLALLRPGGALGLAEAVVLAAPLLRECQTVLVAAPTWRAALQLPPVLSTLRERGGRLIVALVDVSTFGGRGRTLALSSSEVDALAAGLMRDGVVVCRVGAGEDLERCLEPAFTRAR